jgi:hypothetical protein
LEWLRWLFGELLAAPPPCWNGPVTQRILLVDGTQVRSIGPQGTLWRLHCAYHLLTGTLAWMPVTTQQIGESLGLERRSRNGTDEVDRKSWGWLAQEK